jgi:hypothetical protein
MATTLPRRGLPQREVTILPTPTPVPPPLSGKPSGLHLPLGGKEHRRCPKNLLNLVAFTPDLVIREARKIARANGWQFLEPVAARRNRTFPWMGARWTVASNDGMRGRNVRIVFDDATGNVLEKGYLPR